MDYPKYDSSVEHRSSVLNSGALNAGHYKCLKFDYKLAIGDRESLYEETG
jgi:hypothetical protein